MPGTAGAGQFSGVDEHYGPAVVQELQQRLKARIAQIAAGVVGQQYDPVREQGVQGVLGLRQGALHVRQRERREEPEPLRPGGDHLCTVFVDLPRPPPCLRSVPEVHAGRGQGQDAGLHVVPVHELQR